MPQMKLSNFFAWQLWINLFANNRLKLWKLRLIQKCHAIKPSNVICGIFKYLSNQDNFKKSKFYFSREFFWNGVD